MRLEPRSSQRRIQTKKTSANTVLVYQMPLLGAISLSTQLDSDMNNVGFFSVATIKNNSHADHTGFKRGIAITAQD